MACSSSKLFLDRPHLPAAFKLQASSSVHRHLGVPELWIDGANTEVDEARRPTGRISGTHRSSTRNPYTAPRHGTPSVACDTYAYWQLLSTREPKLPIRLQGGGGTVARIHTRPCLVGVDVPVCLTGRTLLSWMDVIVTAVEQKGTRFTR